MRFLQPLQFFKPSLVLVPGILLCWNSSGQNLVPNGDFEEFIFCPDQMSQFNAVETWFEPTIGTPDYFNACDSTNEVSVPSNFMGSQSAQSGGAYTGIFIAQTGGPLYREYLEVELAEALLPGKPYLFEMYVSLADASSCWPNMICAYFADKKLTDYSTAGVITQPSHIMQTLCSDQDEYISDR